jgi:hypothetical protein
VRSGSRTEAVARVVVVGLPNAGGERAIIGSASLGLLWCAIAPRAGSVRWTIASHVLTDAADLCSPNVRFLAGH